MTESDSPIIKYIVYESAKKTSIEILNVTFLDGTKLFCDFSKLHKIGFCYWDFKTPVVDGYYNDYTIEARFYKTYNPNVIIYFANIGYIKTYDEDSIVSIEFPDDNF